MSDIKLVQTSLAAAGKGKGIGAENCRCSCRRVRPHQRMARRYAALSSLRCRWSDACDRFGNSARCHAGAAVKGVQGNDCRAYRAQPGRAVGGRQKAGKESRAAGNSYRSVLRAADDWSDAALAQLPAARIVAIEKPLQKRQIVVAPKELGADRHRRHAKDAVSNRLISLISQLRFAFGLRRLRDQCSTVEPRFAGDLLNHRRLGDVQCATPDCAEQRVDQLELLLRWQRQRRDAKRKKRIERMKGGRV